MATIGFIELGRMGGAMAAHRVRAGHAVRGFDRAAAALSDAAGRTGLTAAGSAIEAAAGAEIVVTMLPHGEHVLAVGSEIAPYLSRGGLLIDCATTDVASAHRAHAIAAMGRRVVRCGDAGSGQAAKIRNDLILGVSMMAVTEAFALAERLGLG